MFQLKHETTFDDWILQSHKKEGSKTPQRPTYLISTITLSDNPNVVLRINVFRQSEQKNWVVVFYYPGKIDQNVQPILAFDGGLQALLPIHKCDQGRYCETWVNENVDDLLALMEGEKSGTITVKMVNAGPVSIPFSLKGFGKAFNALKKKE